MPFGRGNKGRTTQRSHTAAIQRINAARVARRVSAATRVSAKSKAPQAKAPQPKAPQPKANTQNVREPPPDRGTVRSNQEQIAISLINNKLDTVLELLRVDDPNTNIIITFDQLNVRLDNLISSLKEKKKEEDRDKYAHGTHQDIQYAFN